MQREVLEVSFAKLEEKKCEKRNSWGFICKDYRKGDNVEVLSLFTKFLKIPKEKNSRACINYDNL